MDVQRRFRGDGGFTLVEILISLVITSAILGALVGALEVSLGPDTDASQRLAESHDAQLISTYLPADLQSARLDDAAQSTSPTMGLTCTSSEGMGINVLALGWPTEPGMSVSYRVLDTGTERQLVRFSCTDAGEVERLVMAHNLDTDTATPVTVPAPFLGSRVTMNVREESGFAYSVTGSRRTTHASETPETTPSTIPPPPTNPCTVSNFTVDPTSVAQGDAAGHLAADVAVSVTLEGLCNNPIEVAFAPNGPSVRQVLTHDEFNNTWVTTIPGATYTWTTGDKTLSIWHGGASGEAIPPERGGTATLTVTPYPVCSVTSVTADRNPVKRNTGSHGGTLKANLTITVKVSGPCSTPVWIRFTPGNCQTVTVKMTGSGANWTYTIPKAAYDWTSGPKSITVLNSSKQPIGGSWANVFTVST
jgi:prepilin-type N-terminal cleavage/methylation domain-containing protein